MRNKKFISICKKSQAELKEYLFQFLKLNGYDPIKGDGYLYAKGTNVPVLLTAHLDTVHVERVETVIQCGDVLSSPQGIGGDDRCGVFMIMRIISKTELRPSILFCEDEESGGIGASKFTRETVSFGLSSLKFIIELDRANANDAVFYDCYNPDFTDWICENGGFEEAYGTFSDICILSPACGVASVNLSCGYYKQHTKAEYVCITEMYDVIRRVIDLLEKAKLDETPQFEFLEDVRMDLVGNFDVHYGVELSYYDRELNQIFDEWVNGTSVQGCFGTFFIEHPNICYNDVLDYEKY